MNNKEQTYQELFAAYSHFNSQLFDGELPECMIVMQRHRSAYGYFWGSTWKHDKGSTVDEIALNPDHFETQSTQQVLATLVHEQCHLWQHHFGKPSRSGYHNRQWAKKMLAVGLIPTDTGYEGGKQTGQRVSHYIEKNGVFETACKQLLAQGFALPWVSIAASNTLLAQQKRASKTRYSCEGCGLNAWAKPDVRLKCADCDEVMLVF